MKYLRDAKVVVLGMSILLSVVFAEEPLSKEAERYLDETRTATGDLIENAANGAVTNDKIGGRFDNYMDTVIWNDTFSKKTDKMPQQQLLGVGEKSIVLDTPADKMKKIWDAEEEKLAIRREKERNATKAIPSSYAGGYCTFDTTLSISKSNEYGKLDCLLDFGHGNYRKAEVFASFYPDYKREIVIALPIYVTFENQNKATLSGVILNAGKTSINIAGWVDNKRIQKMLGEGLLGTNDVIYNYVSGYMRALERSRTQSGIEYITSTDPQTGNTTTTPVSTTKTEKPEIKDYVISAGIEIVSSIFSVVGKDYMESTYPLFAVYPQKLYVEGVVSFDNQGLAKRFGTITAEVNKKSKQNNSDWLRKKDTTIQKYDRTYRGGSLGGTN